MTSFRSRAILTLAVALWFATPVLGANPSPAAAPAVVSAGDLAANPDKYVGKTVTVRSDVATVYGSRMFTLDEDRIGASPDVLVLVPDHANVSVDKTVTVTGPVRRFVWTELRRDFDWFDLRPSFDVVFRSRPVVVATSVKSSDMAELVGVPLATTIAQITQDPGNYYGEFVEIDAPVGTVDNAHAFTLGRGTGRPDVLVLIPEPETGAAPTAKAEVKVRGVVRPFFITDLERDYDWFGLQRDLVVQIEDRPVVVAESVRNAQGKELVHNAGAAGALKPSARR